MGRNTLFREGRAADKDLLLLLEVTETFLFGDEIDHLLQDFMQFAAETVEHLRPRLLRGEVPLVALEVVCASALLVQPKDYNADPCWDAALALADSLPGPHPHVTDRQSDDCSPEMVAFASWFGPLIARAQQGKSLDAREHEIALSLLTFGPLGLCSQWPLAFLAAYPVIDAADVSDPYWQALELVIQVLAGNDEALESLGALADDHPRSPSLLWLDEFLCRLAGHEAQASERAAQIEARLGEGDLGANAPQLCARMLSYARDFITREQDPPHAIWPFRITQRTAEVREVVSSAAHYLTMNFRMLRGIEMLASSTQRLARLLSAGSS
jgi:hypothetical protein